MNSDWDDGNRGHATRHGVSMKEVEEAVLDPRRIIRRAYRFRGERRFGITGAARSGRIITVIYTLRPEGVRPFAAWPANNWEEQAYQEATK
ncbi:MAG: BrnT family toxin [Dehalococcoidia bacterium]